MAAPAGGNDLGAGGTNMEISYRFSPFVRRQWHRFDAVAFFNRVLDLLFKLLIFFVVLALAMGLIKMFLEVWSIMVARELKDAFGFIVTNLLTFFIILELFKSLVEYFREHRLKLTFIVDATLVFILREVRSVCTNIKIHHRRSVPWRFWRWCSAPCAPWRLSTRPWSAKW